MNLFRWPVAAATLIVALIAAAAVTASAQQPCPPSQMSRDGLLALRAQRFATNDDARASLALALLPCLANRDPVLRDDVAVSALSAWLRGRLLSAPVVRQLAERALSMLTAPADSAGFSQSFSALALSEIVRADRLDSALAPGTLAAISEAAGQHMAAIRDYRGFDSTDGWRHDVAHSSDLILQLGMHPRLDAAAIERLLDALASQVGAHDGHVYLESESERMARAVVFIYGRRVLGASFWDPWLRALADPGPLPHWGAALQSPEGRARRQNVLTFLHTLGFAARVTRPDGHEALALLIDRELRRLVAI